MKAKQAGRLKLFWVGSMVGIFTLWSCLKIISGSLVLKNNRRFIDRIMWVWANRLLALIEVKTQVKGTEYLKTDKEKPVIVMCNHSSLFDMPIAINALNISFRFVAKKELFRIPIFGTAIGKAEFISIDRHDREQALKDLQRAKFKMLDGITLWIAPEGTRSVDGQLGRFKRGGFHIAIDTNALIIPVVIKGAHKVQPGNEIKLFTNQVVEVEICKPIDAAKFTVEQRHELVTTVRHRMLTSLGQREEN